MIIICEPQCKGFEHTPVNSAFIAASRQAFSDKKILFLAEIEHLNLVKANLEKNNILDIDYQIINIAPRNISDVTLQRLPVEFSLYKHIFNIAKNNNAENIIFLSITSSGILSIKILQFFFKSIKSHAILHGILATLPINSLNLKKLLGNTFRLIFLAGNTEKLNYLVLGEPIKRELLQKFNFLNKFVKSIDHPYFFKSPYHFEPFKDNLVKFGNLGVANKAKQSHLFFDLAKDIKSSNLKTSAEFVLMGHVTDKETAAKLNSDFVKTISLDKPLNNAEFDKNIRLMDYAVFFYNKDEYKLRASGALFDAFSYTKPIIAIKNPYFEYYFNKLGNIGYLCENYDELKSVIINIIKNKPVDRYSEQRENLILKREKINISEISKNIKETI